VRNDVNEKVRCKPPVQNVESESRGLRVQINISGEGAISGRNPETDRQLEVKPREENMGGERTIPK